MLHACCAALQPLGMPAGSRIAQQVVASPFFQEARSVALYITCERLREVDTMALLQAALQQGVLRQMHMPVQPSGAATVGSG